MVRRRDCLALVATALGPLAAARAANGKPSPLPQLRIYVPGGVGGGWDQTGHALGDAALAAGLAQKVVYENKGGKGGTIGLADFVERFNQDPAALLVGGMVMVGAIAASQPKVTLAQVTPLARLTNDYLALVVPAGSKLANLKALNAELQRGVGGVVFTGGSLGGVDHMLAGMMIRQMRLDTDRLRYEPATAAKESLALLDSGKAQILISGYSELKAEIEAKRVVALAVSSRRGLHGIASLSEQGLPIELANWRGVFAPAGISDVQKAALRDLVVSATESTSWQQAVIAKEWMGALLVGEPFKQALEVDQSIAGVVAHMLKLKG
ncbi:MAG TPA: tripartite tricarboxylate transporter substrate-binding protein [Ideonella sp.]|uniref:Bug family tripartite tricarboxylate transporter substrate binding protein n=1 Tax=Ideonella sp. TaxID=1929293 RepID=UPI002E32C2A2|nr:tripartite tricarboxylate transporter substrate-binding protein [Ideonella sp.]HEX5683936.1 tripartite tricarboxylate transporter substrate-binding protein [Ideonella sp.]